MVYQYRNIVNTVNSEGDDVWFSIYKREKTWKMDEKEHDESIPNHEFEESRVSMKNRHCFHRGNSLQLHQTFVFKSSLYFSVLYVLLLYMSQVGISKLDSSIVGV